MIIESDDFYNTVALLYALVFLALIIFWHTPMGMRVKRWIDG